MDTVTFVTELPNEVVRDELSSPSNTSCQAFILPMKYVLGKIKLSRPFIHLVYFIFAVCLDIGIVTFRRWNMYPQEFSQVLNIRSTDIKTIFSSRSLQDHSAKLARLQNETIAHRPVLENVSLAGHLSVAITVTSYKK